jgi:F-type H+-transporting ATPase subunit g
MIIAYRDPVSYNLSVAREFLKQIYVAEKLAPPRSFAEVRTAYTSLYERLRQPGLWRELMQSGQLAKVAIYAVEAYGIFKVCLHPL